MNNNFGYQFFKQIAQSSPKIEDVKLNKRNDFSAYDASFIAEHVEKNDDILDLGSGTGLIISKLTRYVSSISAVEPFKEFTDYIPRDPKITVINEEIHEYTTDRKFDVITIFGLMQYFDKAETEGIYKKYALLLKANGKMIIKNQFGVTDDVVVSGYSEELKKNYWSEYRTIENERKLLRSAGFESITPYDIYPSECNRWTNTHFYAIIAVKG